MRHLVVWALVLFSGCKGTSTTTPASSMWIDFEGIQYRAPVGTTMNVEDGVLQGPDGLGGIPSGERIEANISKSAAFYVQLLRTRVPSTLEGTKQSLLANHVGRNLKGTVTETGWELSYELIVNGTSSGKAHVIYTEIAQKHYECSWADVNCPDPAAAEALCRSLRPKS
jgi:hypothetical protein